MGGFWCISRRVRDRRPLSCTNQESACRPNPSSRKAWRSCCGSTSFHQATQRCRPALSQSEQRRSNEKALCQLPHPPLSRNRGLPTYRPRFPQRGGVRGKLGGPWPRSRSGARVPSCSPRSWCSRATRGTASERWGSWRSFSCSCVECADRELAQKKGEPARSPPVPTTNDLGTPQQAQANTTLSQGGSLCHHLSHCASRSSSG
jgi:hypothetical protein